jgi:lipopolysaccharide O-acetyltransferase
MTGDHIDQPTVAARIRRLWQGYGLLGLLRLAGDWLHTRFLFPEARIVRRPVFIRGRRHIHLGGGLTTGVGNRLDAFPSSSQTIPILSIGDNVEINDHCHIAAIERVTIGDDCLIASRVFISDHNHGTFGSDDPLFGPDQPPSLRPLSSRPVTIGKRVWIGEAAIILPGVTIGDGAIIGAGAIVTRDVPNDTIVAGNPARPMRRFDRASNRWEQVDG